MDLKQIINVANTLEVVEGTVFQENPELVISLIMKYDFTPEKRELDDEKIEAFAKKHRLSLQEAAIVSAWNKLKKHVASNYSKKLSLILIEVGLRYLSQDSSTIAKNVDFPPILDEPFKMRDRYSREVNKLFAINFNNMLRAIQEFCKTKVVISLTEQSRRVCLKYDWIVEPHVQNILFEPMDR